MPTPRSTALAAFQRRFGRAPARLVQAPGRVNLIGEHTDYNDGFVLPCAIDRGTVVAAAPRDDRVVRVVAADLGDGVDEFHLDRPIVPRADATWTHYVRGPVKHLLAHGHALAGADLAVSGDVPQGAGLSSSASLQLAVLQAFKGLGRLDTLAPSRMALLAQEAENRFAGCDCGIMDPLISALGVEGHALLIDCRTLDAQPVPLPAGAAVMIVHSRVRRGLVGSAYNLRRQQCETAARHFGVKALRDLSVPMFEARAIELDPVVRRRARHVLTENDRTVAAARALAAGDLREMGALMAASHDSMRVDFEITVPPVDELVRLLQQVIGDAGGARMTGGGFGGCVVALLPESLVPQARDEVARHYRSPSGEPADVHVCHASNGAGDLPLQDG
ncbi:galactokinase [Piscinibacter sp. XHJ-5]|uniref:galactokinase n=1 Tax=Piscinibacter sp. XHJ-5 TaxID=3037797 RepID=UPI002452E88F|nr:galactokinase [Piscinibacter sp. XHJ-5]